MCKINTEGQLVPFKSTLDTRQETPFHKTEFSLPKTEWYREKLWTTKNKTKIAVRDMATDHIINSGKLVYRQLIATGNHIQNLKEFDMFLDDEYLQRMDFVMETYAECYEWCKIFSYELLYRELNPEYESASRVKVNIDPMSKVKVRRK